MNMNSYPHMVHDYYVARVRAIHQERSERLRSIRTKRQAMLYQQKVRKAIKRAFSPRPRRTALKPCITGVLQRLGYRIEKLTFESRPGCLVTANLYIPDNLEKPAPGQPEAPIQSPVTGAYLRHLRNLRSLQVHCEPF